MNRSEICSTFYEVAEEWKDVIEELYRHADIETWCDEINGANLVAYLYPTKPWNPSIAPMHMSVLHVTCGENKCSITGDIVAPDPELSSLVRSIPDCAVEEVHRYRLEEHIHFSCRVSSMRDVAEDLRSIVRVARIADKEWGFE